MNPREARERAEQEAAEKSLRDWAWKGVAEEQEEMREQDARVQFPRGRSSGPLHSIDDDYSAWQGMEP